MSRTPAQIAADRARYEEHQRKGLEFATKALPEPSPLPATPIDPQNILHTETIAGGWYWSTTLRKGEALRIEQPHGASSVALVCWSLPTEILLWSICPGDWRGVALTTAAAVQPCPL